MLQQTKSPTHPAHVSPQQVVDFDIYQPMLAGMDLHESWRALQESGAPDVVWTPRNGGHWMVLRGRLITKVLLDYQTFSSRVIFVPKEPAGEAYRAVPITLDPPHHRPVRSLLNEDLSPKKIKSREDSIRAMAVQMIESFRMKGRCDFVRDFAEQMPLRIFMQMVDLPFSDAPRLKYLADQYTRPEPGVSYEDVGREFMQYLQPIILARRGKDGTDMLSHLINGMIEGRELTDEEAGNLCVQILVAGLDTVVNAMSFIMLFLARSPESRQALTADLGRLSASLQELLRRFSMVTVAREITRDLEFEGAHLKRGEMMVVPTLLHGLDSRENPDPMTVDFTRRSVNHSIFGGGIHTCAGAHLAKTEIRVMLEEWLTRIPDFRVADAAEIQFVGGIVASVKPFSLVWDVATTRG
jgi:camphor 5-monooxygenase